MVRLMETLFATALALMASGASAAKIVPECGLGIGKCPSTKPCCSQYGQCGIGAYCLGGCDAIFSTTLNSCVPVPVCQSKKSTFETGLNKVTSIYKFLGDADQHDWVYEGNAVSWNNNLLLTMAEGTVGTVVSSTHYVWYGKVGATLKTSKGKGVVSAFILFSGVKDEIDFEWIGVNLNEVQTNYYWQGHPIYTNGGVSGVNGNTHEEWHTYEIDWKPDSITWLVDGKVARVKQKKDTWNEKTKSYDFPQTPSRVQLSLWPGGLASNEEGTITWAGGLIDWNDPEMKKTGYYFAEIKELSIECYDAPSSARKVGDKSYIYDKASGLEDSVVISNKGTVLKSFLGSGEDMDKVLSSGAPKPTENIETIPGNTGGGTSVGDILSGENGDGTSFGDEVQGTKEFIQNHAGKNAGSTGAMAMDTSMRGSILAVVIAIAGLMMM